MIVVENLSKKFSKYTAVDNVSFSVKKGEVFALLGENGAGKTTTLRMLATMLSPTSGGATLEGYDILTEPEKVRANMGVLFGGETGLYDRLTVTENIAYFAELNDMDKAEIKKRTDYLASFFKMEPYMDRKAGKLSKGMKQKVAFARSIVHDPEIMLFDEPTSGLDVSAIKNVHDFILECKGEGKTVILSSHSMSEVEKLCDNIGIIHKGRMIFSGTIEELGHRYGDRNLEEIFLEIVEGDSDEG